MGEIGFAHLPNQVHLEAVKNGFEFNIMVVGQSGLGKSTLVNSLFATSIYEEGDYAAPGQRIPSTTKVERSTVTINEKGVVVRLSLVDTPGFGNAIDNSDCWRVLIEDIEKSFEKYLDDESSVNREKITDSRVHACFYFITPTGHRLKPLDIEVMKQLQDKVNIIPIIAKADTMTVKECDAFKDRILQDIQDNGISIYKFPQEDDEDEPAAPQEVMPFAVCASVRTMLVSGKKVRGRAYPWGVVDADNKEHGDFTLLRDLIIRRHMQHLIDTTNDVHYENFRAAKLGELGISGKANVDSEENLLELFEKQKIQHEKKMKKMEAEMTQVFEVKVKEKEKKLKDMEAKYLKQHDDMKRQLQEQKRALEEKQREFEEDKKNFNLLREQATSKADLKKKSTMRLF